MDEILLSFVIPAFNEREHIGGVIQSISTAAEGLPHEIIVVDNGSDDATGQLAEDAGARVLVRPGITISALRNAGGAVAHGRILAFIDADVYLEKDWGENAKPVIQYLLAEGMVITGSTYGVSERAGFLGKAWFEPIVKKPSTKYINGGHLIIRSDAFKLLGGFDESLETGEDYEFCQRARKAGAEIVNNPALRVIHEGYPGTLAAFFRRERWHGRGDYGSVVSILSSKPAILSLAQSSLLLSSLPPIFLSMNFTLFLVYLLFVLAICTTSAVHRCRGTLHKTPVCTLLYFIYFMARTLAFLDVVLLKAIHSSKRRECDTG